MMMMMMMMMMILFLGWLAGSVSSVVVEAAEVRAGPSVEVEIRDGHYYHHAATGGVVRQREVRRAAGETVEGAALRFARDYLGTADAPALAKALRAAEPGNLETDRVLAERVLAGEDATKLALRAAVSRGLPLEDYPVHARGLEREARRLGRGALVACAAAATEHSPAAFCAPLIARGGCATAQVASDALGLIDRFVANGEPYMSAAEVDLVEAHLGNLSSSARSREDGSFMTRVLEYGAGISTLRFSALAGSYESVEHSAEWCGATRCALARLHDDCQLAPTTTTTTTTTPRAALLKRRRCSRPVASVHVRCAALDADRTDETLVRAYVGLANNNENQQPPPRQFYDAVLIDGLARAAVAARALPHLRASSLVFFHDFFASRPSGCWRCSDIIDNHVVLDLYDVVDALVDFPSLAVLRPKPHLAGLSWDDLVRRSPAARIDNESVRSLLHDLQREQEATGPAAHPAHPPPGDDDEPRQVETTRQEEDDHGDNSEEGESSQV